MATLNPFDVLLSSDEEPEEKPKEEHPVADIIGTCDGTCDDPECMPCGAKACPHGEPLHGHHDGCPSCDLPEEPLDETEDDDSSEYWGVPIDDTEDDEDLEVKERVCTFGDVCTKGVYCLNAHPGDGRVQCKDCINFCPPGKSLCHACHKASLVCSCDDPDDCPKTHFNKRPVCPRKDCQQYRHKRKPFCRDHLVECTFGDMCVKWHGFNDVRLLCECCEERFCSLKGRLCVPCFRDIKRNNPDLCRYVTYPTGCRKDNCTYYHPIVAQGTTQSSNGTATTGSPANESI